MELFNEVKAAELQETRIKQFTESLSNLRTADESDVCLVCQGKEFFAHKLVLQTASPYFATMLNTKMKEEKSGRVTFVDMECQTLEAILDFIYLGRVENVKTEEQCKKLLAASHLTQLEGLFQYCCDALRSIVSLENFFEYFQLSIKYDSDCLLNKLHAFWHINSDNLLNSAEFLMLSVLEVKSLINCVKCKNLCLDSAVGGVIKWLYHDLQEREKFAGEVLKSEDGQFLSKEFVKSMLQKKDLMGSSQVISSLLKELSLVAFTSDMLGKEQQICQAMAQEINLQPWITKLTCISGECKVDVFDPASGALVDSVIKRNCTQEFDLCSMTWLPVRCVALGNNFEWYSQSCYCRQRREIHLFPPGPQPNYPCCYNMQNNSISTSHLMPLEILSLECRIFCFQSYLYKLGEGTALARIGPSRLTMRVNWSHIASLPVAITSPTVLTSEQCIYILGNNAAATDQLALQYTSNPADVSKWQVICIRKKGLDPQNFFLANNTINALYYDDDECKLLAYDHDTQAFAVKRTFDWPATETEILKLSKFQNPQCPFVFFSCKSDSFSIPSFVWELESGKWHQLPPQQGKCRLTKIDGFDMLYSFEE